jgi:hypothetical protein
MFYAKTFRNQVAQLGLFLGCTHMIEFISCNSTRFSTPNSKRFINLNWDSYWEVKKWFTLWYVFIVFDFVSDQDANHMDHKIRRTLVGTMAKTASFRREALSGNKKCRNLLWNTWYWFWCCLFIKLTHLSINSQIWAKVWTSSNKCNQVFSWVSI